jgi:hypothetical protein
MTLTAFATCDSPQGRRAKGAATFATLAMLVAGCGDGRDPRAPVSGRVTYGDAPVPEGRIILYPADGRRQATSALGADGTYSLTTFDSEDGAFLGKHAVVIDAVRTVNSGPASLREEVDAKLAFVPKIERLVPEKYADFKTSPLEAQVEDRDNTIDFDIPR